LVSDESPQALSTNVDFDFNGLSDPPDDTQNTIHQAALCKADDGIADIPNSGCLVFNSRGTPVNTNGDPDGDEAFYITDHETGVYGVTVSATPLVRLWWSPASVKAWVHK